MTDRDDLTALPWRTGRSVGRTVYAQLGPEPSDDDPLLGLMDTRELAERAVKDHNRGIAFGRWYRTLLPDGSLWCETSNPSEGYLVHTDPSVPLTWQRITASGDWVEWSDHPTDLAHPADDDDNDEPEEYGEGD